MALLDKFGSVGAVIAALACPICFPKLALIGAALGLGVLAPYEQYIALVIQGLFVLASFGQYVAYRKHGNKWVLSLSITATILMFLAYYVIPSSILLQLSLGGLVAASVWQVVESRRCARCAT